MLETFFSIWFLKKYTYSKHTKSIGHNVTETLVYYLVLTLFTLLRYFRSL